MLAAWFWASNGLNTLADAGDNQNIGSVINTGKIGRVANSEVERQAFYGKALKVQDWRYGKQLADQSAGHKADLATISNAAADQVRTALAKQQVAEKPRDDIELAPAAGQRCIASSVAYGKARTAKKTPSSSEGVFSVIAKFSINQQRVVQRWRLPSGLAATHPPA